MPAVDTSIQTTQISFLMRRVQHYLDNPPASTDFAVNFTRVMDLQSVIAQLIINLNSWSTALASDMTKAPQITP